jgi:thiamine-monophosphate kinase
MIRVNELQLLSSSLPLLPGNDRVLTGSVGNSLLSGHHLAFSPRLDLAEFMLEEASAMLDISDGLLLDAMRLAEYSNVSLMLDFESIPLRAGAVAPDAFSDGEDYELLLTVEPSAFNTVAEALRAATGTTLTAIGTIVEGNGIEWLENGKPTEIEMRGFEHF